jgi:transcriptional regulator with XRE-family HTH domain
MTDSAPDVLIQELTSFCKARRGRISELAQALEVPSERVSNWLHGRFTPRPETRALMQSWLEAARAQEKVELEADSARRHSLVNSLRRPSPRG